MLSRFNLDVKRMYYYDDKEKFNLEFKKDKELDNKDDLSLKIDEYSIIIILESKIKVSLSTINNSKKSILYSGQSISLVPGDIVTISKAVDKVSKFLLYTHNKIL